jgi:hypothetical protein
MSKCKVIATSGNPTRAIRLTCAYPDHRQNVDCLYDLYQMWMYNLVNERTKGGGEEFDTVVVCNDSTAYSFWRFFDGERTANGVFVILRRENVGGSFGAYSHVYEVTDYDEFLFTEEDLIVSGENYYTKIVQRFQSIDLCGFVGLIGCVYKEPQHCHGGCGYTTRKILDTIQQGGELPYYKGRGWERHKVILDGEIPFTNEIIRHGYKIIQINDDISKWHESNLIQPYYDLTH